MTLFIDTFKPFFTTSACIQDTAIGTASGFLEIQSVFCADNSYRYVYLLTLADTFSTKRVYPILLKKSSSNKPWVCGPALTDNKKADKIPYGKNLPPIYI